MSCMKLMNFLIQIDKEAFVHRKYPFGDVSRTGNWYNFYRKFLTMGEGKNYKSIDRKQEEVLYFGEKSVILGEEPRRMNF